LITTDPRWVAPTHRTLAHRLLSSVVRDERDTIFVKTALEISLVLPPLAVLLVLAPDWLTGVLAAPWLAFVFARYTGRYMLMVHAICHRPPFTRRHAWIERWIFWGLGPLFGCTPTSFFAHHMGMHHPENNLEADLSCTLPYQRDRFGDFLHYWARFFFVGLFHLVRYFVLRGRTKLARRLLVGELSWVAALVAFALVDLPAALVLLVAPFLLLRWLMMCGNFAQHAFVDVDDPANAYKNSTCLTNTRYNHKCYNDGYHIVHHLKPALHWSEMAEHYERNRDEYARNDAVVFDGIRDNQQVWWLLMTGQYGKLADHLVDFRGRTREERIAFLKDRVQRRRGEVRPLLALEPRPTVAA
jgi:fatty acid desaturase